MPISVAAPPQPVAIFSGFDYVTIDELHHRAYAAHPASKRLLVVDTSSGKVLAQVDVGPMHGVAVDPNSGAVFTGNGTRPDALKSRSVEAESPHERRRPGEHRRYRVRSGARAHLCRPRRRRLRLCDRFSSDEADRHDRDAFRAISNHRRSIRRPACSTRILPRAAASPSSIPSRCESSKSSRRRSLPTITPWSSRPPPIR